MLFSSELLKYTFIPNIDEQYDKCMKLHSEELAVLLEVIHNECEGNKNYIPTFGGEISPYVFTKSAKTQMI
jgi:hypothetical protein